MKKFLGFLATIILLALIVIVVLLLTGKLGFGFGTGDGFGIGSSDSPISFVSDTRSAESERAEIVIKVYEDKIYYNGELCEDTEELKKLISDDAAEGAVFTFEQEYGIKATLDEVKALLSELKKSIGIEVNGID